MQNQGNVALLVDFENLVFGLRDSHGEDYPESVDPELLFRLAEEYGQVVLANAYADWRSREINQFQTDLYRLGIDLIHVFAKRQQNRFKNAVDVKMAVDAVETIWTLPHVRTFVIVSGDRDFIHVLKALRRHGKSVVGVSPDQAASEDFAALCDRFVRYGALVASYGASRTGGAEHGPSQGEQLRAVRAALQEIVSERPDGLKGAQIKPLLRRRLSATFDESEYGFSRLTDLLVSLADVVSVVPSRSGGDITVLPAGQVPQAEAAPAAAGGHDARVDTLATRLARAAELPRYAFETDFARRRAVLATLFAAMKAEEPFMLADVFERVLQDTDIPGLSLSKLARYQSILWQSRCFAIEPEQQGKSIRERLMRLAPEIATADDLAVRYERSIVYKLAAAARAAETELDARVLCQALGLPETEEELDYCGTLLSAS